MERKIANTETSSALSELLQTGHIPFEADQVKYVCHTSTIPLASTIDEQYILRTCETTVEVNHSTKYLDPMYQELVPYRCCKVHCMYTGKRGGSSSEILRDTCPCNSIKDTQYLAGEEVELHLQPLCFLQVLKELRYDFGYVDASTCPTDDECCHNEYDAKPKSTRPSISFSSVMFCSNSQSIFGTRYSRPLRDKIGCSNWESIVKPEQLAEALDSLYFYRKFVSARTRDRIGELVEASLKDFKRVFTQVIYTLDGLLCKKFLCFPCEMEDYRSLAQRTAGLFEALVSDYFRVPHEDDIADETSSIFLRMKSSFKFVKEHFNATERENRMEVFDCIELKSDAFSRFWGSAFRRLKKRIVSAEEDYTTSIAWFTSMSGFSQTRNLGYLPTWVSVFRRKVYRKTITREKISIPKDQLLVIRKTIRKRALEANIPPEFLRAQKPQELDIFVECINAIRIPLEVKASVHSTVADGGKIEDARQILNLAMEHRWKVPRYDLQTGSRVELFQMDRSMMEEKPAFEGYLFWIALQILLNKFSKIYEKRYKEFFSELPGSEQWEEELFQMEIVHISEPGKERNLTKSSALLAWVLTVCSKVSQMALSYNQDHRAGLVLSAQDWMHQKRISPESQESYFIYDRETRLRKDDVWNSYQDWTESTDYIPREVGGISLESWLGYIGFPDWYKKLILLISQMDYEVYEDLAPFEVTDGQPRRWNGLLTEGFMMGNPLTKTILHLMHDVNFGAVSTLLEVKFGVKFPTFREILRTSSVGPPNLQYQAILIKPEEVLRAGNT